ncbi:hypothetical protein GDO78_002293 [Eleutherodactylus coqui]|uniref:Uncharacterized protein n=1 Tax=Eleutherodactylus coqui TaxID=57060 RepID=A0A8J6EVK8_ELECQ|nr:hypothetical protein GDO78_002293 [Eleutherodactylus coqui]
MKAKFDPETPKLSLFEIEEETKRLQREVRSWQQNVESANNWQESGEGVSGEAFRTVIMMISTTRPLIYKCLTGRQRSISIEKMSWSITP